MITCCCAREPNAYHTVSHYQEQMSHTIQKFWEARINCSYYRLKLAVQCQWVGGDIWTVWTLLFFWDLGFCLFILGNIQKKQYTLRELPIRRLQIFGLKVKFSNNSISFFLGSQNKFYLYILLFVNLNLYFQSYLQFNLVRWLFQNWLKCADVQCITSIDVRSYLLTCGFGVFFLCSHAKW